MNAPTQRACKQWVREQLLAGRCLTQAEVIKVNAKWYKLASRICDLIDEGLDIMRPRLDDGTSGYFMTTKAIAKAKRAK